jgi:hypothetical protein
MNDVAVVRAGDEWPDRWFVTNGVVAVGPVSFGLLLRGVAVGRIPPGSVVRHESWRVWRRLEDIGALSSDGRQRTVDDLATLSSSLELRASSPFSEPPPPPSAPDLRASTPPSERTPRSSTRPVLVDPVGVLEQAHELGQALLLTLSTAAAAASAEVGLIHRPRPDLGAVVCVGGHGPGTERLLGERVAQDDPTLTAANAGYSIVGEPEFGENSRYLLGRLGRCLPGVQGVAMVSLILHGDLVAFFELGRTSRPFRAREVARAEDVIDALAGRCVVMGWI